MAAEQFEVGEHVDITIRNVKVVNTFKDTPLNASTRTVLVFKLPSEDTERDRSYTAPIYDDVTVKRVAPAEWPPQPGDLWRDREGELWFAYVVHEQRSSYVDMRCEDDGKGLPPFGDDGVGGVNERFGPMTLVHREPEPDWTWDDENNPRSATDPSGKVLDLTAHYRDGKGQTWHWAGGFGRDHKGGPMRPLMSRDDYLRMDVQITDVPGPLTQVPRVGGV